MKIVQVCSAVYTGDGVGKDILSKTRLIEELGYTCEVYAEDIDPLLKGRVKNLSELTISEKDILLHHYAGYTHLVDIVKTLPCTKVLVYHNITPPELVAPDMRPACVQSYQQLPSLKMVYDYYLPVSKYNLNDLIQYGVTLEGDILPIEVSFEDTAIDHSFVLPKNKFSTNFLFVGRIVKNKMQEDILKIFEYYYTHFNKNAHLYLPGSWDASPDYYEELQRMADTLCCKKNIHFLGKISDQELVKQFKQADLYLSMSRHEGFGIPLLEAMHYQIPVFAYDAAAVGDTLGDAGVLLKTTDPKEVSSIIYNVLQDTSQYTSIINSQNKRLESFSHNVLKEKLAQLIRKWSTMEFQSVEESLIFQRFSQIVQQQKNTEQNCKEIPDYQGTEQSNSNSDSPLEHYLWVMNSTRENYAFRHIYSCRKVIGGAIVFCKRVVRKLLKWYIEPICFQQTDFNNASVKALEIISNQIESQKQQYQDTLHCLEQETSSTRETVANLNRDMESMRAIQETVASLDNEMLGMKSVKETVVNLSNELQTAVSKSNKLENDVLHREEQLSNQLQYMSERVEAMEHYIKKMDQLNLGIFDDDPLLFWERDKTAQSGEDSIVAMAAGTMGISPKEITYLDIGANHAKYISNTYFFYRNGARGVLVEANPQLIPELKFYRHGDVILNRCVTNSNESTCPFYILNGDGLSTMRMDSVESVIKENPAISLEKTVEIPTTTVNKIMDEFFPAAPVLLSIDIEGIELDILKSIDFSKYRPMFIIVETIPYRANKIVIGEKNEEVIRFMETKKYTEFAFTGINSIFVDKEQVEKIQGGRADK